MATNYNPYLFGQVYDPDKEKRLARLNSQNMTGQGGQAESFATREQARTQREQEAVVAAKDAAAKAQQRMESEAARQQEMQRQERAEALQQAQAKLQADNFTRQMELQNRQFENQSALQQQQEAMRQAQQQYENQLVQRQQGTIGGYDQLELQRQENAMRYYGDTAFYPGGHSRYYVPTAKQIAAMREQTKNDYGAGSATGVLV